MSYQWTKEATDILKKEWEKGTIARKIIDELPMQPGGLLPSRRAIIGKAHRMGLARRNNKHPPTISTKPKKKYTYHNRFTVKPAQSVPLVPVQEFKPRNISILALKETTCRWPMWPQVKGYRYCGLQTKEQSPYCPTHHSEAYGRREWIGG